MALTFCGQTGHSAGCKGRACCSGMVRQTSLREKRQKQCREVCHGTFSRAGGAFLAPNNNMLSAMRVLVADDDHELLDAISDGLVRLGADVTCSRNGAELIENLADKGPFDLVVTDIAMPWMTGVQAIHAARTAGLGTSVIVMTALRDDSIPARVQALGKNAALLYKPFALAELEALALRLLAQRGTQPQPDVGAHR
jgi:CheY-like chemotaxis protein